MSAGEQTREGGAGGRLLAWYGVLGAPLAWTVELLAGYGVQEASCERGSTASALSDNANSATGVLTVAMLLVALGGVLAARTTQRGLDAGALADPRGRLTFMARAGTIASLLFLLAIALSGIPILALDSCHT